MISHLGSVILICGIALTVSAPQYYRHGPEEQYRRHKEPEKEPGKIFCFWGPRREEPVREPEDNYRILEEPEERYRRHGELVKAYRRGDNYFEEPDLDTGYGYDTGYLEPDLDTGYGYDTGYLDNYFGVPDRDTGYGYDTGYLDNYFGGPDLDTGYGYDTGYLDNYFEEPPRDTGYIVEEEYEPPYLVAAYPRVYDPLYDYDYDDIGSYDYDDIGSYDSLDLEGLFLDGFFGSASTIYDSDSSADNNFHVASFFRNLRRNPEYFGYDSSISSSSSSSSEPDNHFKFEFPFDAFFKHEIELAGSQALDSTFERDFVSPVLNPPTFFKEITPESSSSEEDSYDFPYFFDNDSQRSDDSSECSDSDDTVTGYDSEFGIDSDDSSLDSTFFDFLNRNPDYFDFD